MASFLSRALHRSYSICFSNVIDLKPSVPRWSTRSKVIRMFKHRHGIDELYNLILVDEKGDRIHATLSIGFGANFVDSIIEGDWVILAGFDLQPVDHDFRPTDHEFKIMCTAKTSFSKISYRDNANYFTFTKFESILNGEIDPTFCVELIGQVVNIGNFGTRETIHNRRLHYICLELQNERNTRLPIVLDREYSEKFLQDIGKCRHNIIICVIRFASVSLMNASWRATTKFKCAQLLLEPQINEADDLRRLIMANEPDEA